MKRNEFHIGDRFGWCMEEISKTKYRNIWKRTRKKRMRKMLNKERLWI